MLVQKPFQDIITFTRASAATRINASGVLETVGNNVPRIDHGPADVPILGPELVTNGEFNDATGWTLNTGWDVSSGSLNHSAPGVTQPQLSLITQAGKTYQCSYRIVSQSQAGAGVSIRIGGANLTIRNAPGTYTENYTPAGDGSIVSFIARGASGDWLGSIDNVSVREVTGYTVRKGAPKGLLIEEQRTNLLLNTVLAGYSTGSPPAAPPTSWAAGSNGGAVTEVTADGAVRFEATNNRQFLQQAYILSANTEYVYSLRVQDNPGGESLGSLCYWASLPAGATLVYQLNGGAVAQSAIPVSGDVISLKVSVASTGGSTLFRIGIGCNAPTTGYKSAKLSSPQLEVGAFGTSFIPTTGAQATRAADSVRINALSPWYHGALGTIFAELRFPAEGGGTVSNAIFSLDDGTNNNRLTLRKLQSSMSTNFLLVASGSILVNNSLSPGSLSAATVRKVAVSFSGSSYSVAVNGNILNFPGAPGVPAATRLVIGGGAGSSEACANFLKFRYIPKVLSNAELQALTA